MINKDITNKLCKEYSGALIKKQNLMEQINKIDGAMTQEGMPLTNKIKKNIQKCLIGKSTTEIECQKVIERYKKIYG